MKKSIVLVLALCMVCALLLSACGKKAEEVASTAAAAVEEAAGDAKDAVEDAAEEASK